MRVSVITATPEFSGDIADIVRIFWRDAEFLVGELGGDVELVHSDTMHEGTRTSRVFLSGGTIAERTQKETNNPIVKKRLYKRQVKLAVYDAMRHVTGITPPWGSLTGIRPTRLLYEALARGLDMPDALSEIRETFYITDEKAALLEDIVRVQRKLPQPRDDEADLYIGIPFCVSRCAYCSFSGGEVGKGKQLEPYVEALLREIEYVKGLFTDKKLYPRALYMGGGTPTSLTPHLLLRVMQALKEWIGCCREVTVEAGRPDTITAEKLQILKDAGVTRISINPQTVHDVTLRMIGRAHTSVQTEKAYELARQTGFHHINMDLIAGLPGEDLSMFRHTLEFAARLAPESLTIHALSIKRASLFHLWEEQLPDGFLAENMVHEGEKAARGMGLAPYYLYRQKNMAGNLENVGYSLPGHECLYNVDMMEETANILALGAGGSSKRLFSAGARIERVFNVSEASEYIKRIDEMIERKRVLWSV